ncbi:hypothetical protein BLA23254_03846 [Burkholderia lata]|uniref:Uncharacterized protein n=1 Tax=Burkholderia lata (strain ATCC 17760 / DSM 23089 / LMG 22485 / NCIMB 9086 / R18194 / 383) TaxID=482957 RepID=A0A6P2MHX3_BURL3|nr:hypothetical protein BLA23254_03846 [Burkholderia lata]
MLKLYQSQKIKQLHRAQNRGFVQCYPEMRRSPLYVANFANEQQINKVSKQQKSMGRVVSSQSS